MGTYAVTGAASGMGRAAAARLRRDGHTVIGVDLRDVEVIADLATPQGRATAAQEVLARAGDRLDGAVCAAGLGGIDALVYTPGIGPLRKLVDVDYHIAMGGRAYGTLAENLGYSIRGQAFAAVFVEIVARMITSIETTVQIRLSMSPISVIGSDTVRPTSPNAASISPVPSVA